MKATGDRRWHWQRAGRGATAYLALATFVLLVALPGRALALKPIVIEPDRDRVEMTKLGEFYDARRDSLQVETAPAADGMTGRISVTAKTPGTSPNWIVFALTNPTDKPVERWMTADRYNVIGSGAVWPDLDARRIEVVTPSMGFCPNASRAIAPTSSASPSSRGKPLRTLPSSPPIASRASISGSRWSTSSSCATGS